MAGAVVVAERIAAIGGNCRENPRAESGRAEIRETRYVRRWLRFDHPSLAVAAGVAVR